MTAEVCANKADCCPTARAGAAVALNGDNLFMFGGQEDDNKKMNDCWCFDCNTHCWSQIPVEEGQFCPSHRSGHSTVVFGNKMYIFGGIYELTHELNDLCVFDFETRKFSVRGDVGQEDMNGPSNGQAEMSADMRKAEQTPGLKRKQTVAP